MEHESKDGSEKRKADRHPVANGPADAVSNDHGGTRDEH
jgi:hypothetical protein